MKETFIDPLLHPFAAPPPASPSPYDYDEYPSLSARGDSPHESVDVLPIAARFMSPTGFRSDGASAVNPETKSLAPTTPNIDDESAESEMEDDHLPGLQSNRVNVSEKHSHPRSPYRAGSASAGKSSKVKESVPFPSRSHGSLPPTQRINQVNASSQSLGRQSGPERDKDRERKDSAKTTPTVHSRLLRKPKRSQTQQDSSSQTAVPPHLLPEDLRVCLEVIESGVLDGHVKLSEGLRKRYEEQYPLVRSLADVFVSNVRTCSIVVEQLLICHSHTYFKAMPLMSCILSVPLSRLTMPSPRQVLPKSPRIRMLRSGSRCANLYSEWKSWPPTRARLVLQSHCRNHSSVCSSIPSFSKISFSIPTPAHSNTRAPSRWSPK